MNLARWNPLQELKGLSDRINRFFARNGSQATNGNEMMRIPDWVPSVDISETADEYQIKAELPEVKKEDVRVLLEDGVLTLQGERKEDREDNGRRIHRVECSYGWFIRSFVLPDIIEEAKIKAMFKDGMLYLRLPKSDKAKPRAINVKVA
jgi:HSP20 family protein